MNEPTVEQFGPATRAVTVYGKSAVYFAVEHLTGSEWVTTWSRTVPLFNPTRYVAVRQQQKYVAEGGQA